MVLSGARFQEALLPASLSPNACPGIEQPAMLESEDNSPLPGKGVLAGHDSFFMLQPLACINTQTTSVPAYSLDGGAGPPTLKGGVER